jgi:hypothetical protein
MKLTITAIAAMFSLLMLISPSHANAEVTAFPVQQVGYVQPAGYIQQVGYWHYRPWACSNHYFRRHHWYLCR